MTPRGFPPEAATLLTPILNSLPLDAAGDLEDEATAAARRASPMMRSACGTSGLCVGAFVSNEV